MTKTSLLISPCDKPTLNTEKLPGLWTSVCPAANRLLVSLPWLTMAKGDDAIKRKKNKVNRKKIQKDSSKVSARIAALIAAKKRRKSGKRRICEVFLTNQKECPELPFVNFIDL